jgi:hypothetical protein
MADIRAKRRKVAEYLIDQLAINVNHSTELVEFRTHAKIPVRERTLSCRDLAYDKGMMDLVDLIDITSDEIKPSIRRYLQRRLKTRLDEIHQAYLKRLKERNRRVITQSQERVNQLLENEEEEKENEDPPFINITYDTSLLAPPPPPIPVVRRPYKSHIEETIQNIQSKNEKSIDQTGKKIFRFSGYTLRFRRLETTNKNQQINEQVQSKPSPFSLPFIPSTTKQSLPPSLSRPKTTTAATATNTNHRSISEINTRIPIRETRTSICRSARRIATARAASIGTSESKPEVKPTITATINTTQRLLPKRVHQINTNYAYIPQLQHALYNEPRRFMPVTLKATAIGLPSDTRLIRD